MSHDKTPHATADFDSDGRVGDAGDEAPRRDAGGGGGIGATLGEIGAEGGGSPGAQAAQIKRERTGASGPGSEAIDDPHYPNSR